MPKTIELPKAKPQTDTAYGWIVVFASFWVNFIIDGSIYSFGPYLRPMINDLNVPANSVAFISSLQFGFYQISGPLISVLINLLGFQKVSFIGSGITCLGYLLASFTSNFTMTVLTFSIMVGIGSGMIYTTAMLVVSFHFEKYRALATAIVMSGTSIGSFALSLIYQQTLSSWDRVSTLRLQAGLCIITIMGSYFFTLPQNTSEEENPLRHPSSVMFEDTDAMKRQLQSASLETSQMMNQQNDFGLPNMSKKKSLFSLVWNYLLIHFKHSCDVSLFVSPILICLCLSFFIMFLGQLTPFVFIVERAKESGINTSQARWLLPMISVGTLVGRFVAASTIFCPKLNIIIISIFFMFLSGLITVVSSFVLNTNIFFQGTYAVLFGACGAIAATLRSSLLIECMGLEHLTNVWGLTRLFMGISGLFGTPLAELCKIEFGMYIYSFVFAGSCYMLSACVMAVIPLILKNRVDKTI